MTWRASAMTMGAVTVGMSALAAPSLPARVPVHWGLDGQPDRWGSRWELLLLGPGLVLLTGVLVAVFDRIDLVKRPGDDERPKMRVLQGTLGLMAGLHGVILGHVAGLFGDLLGALTLVLAVFWMLIGNELVRVRPNATTGIRTRWTFRSPSIWRRTHRLGGRLMVLAGALGLLGVWWLPGPLALVLLAGLITVSALGSVLYSYLLFRRDPPGDLR